ncbi:MAG: hypothetical protein IJ278_06850 [Clostridia bacterium]|nr:hypothetical protein [Clostridia bacterium]
MKTDSFSKEKHLPVRRFIADESKVATGLYGPNAIAEDIDNIHAMFDPLAEILGGTQQGGISEKNLQDGAVSEQKLAPGIREKLAHTASEELLADLRKELEQAMEEKAGRATTLSGYGITDAHTKEEIAELLSQCQNAEEFQAFRKEVSETLMQKTGETLLHEVTVDTPVWNNQPTFTGALDAGFHTKDFFYVTLKDAAGNDLPDGQFMLKDFYTDDATVYSTVFSLKSLDTGFDTLIENYPVEFTSLTPAVKMRDAGVFEVSYTPENWQLGGEKGNLKIVTFGEFIQRSGNAYFISSFSTDNAVSSYHSSNSSAFQNASTKQIIPYAALGVGNYKTNRFFDECVLERTDNSHYCAKRIVTLRYIKQNSTNYSISTHSVLGYGDILKADTKITEINIQVAAKLNYGVIRNGSVIRISEVK